MNLPNKIELQPRQSLVFTSKANEILYGGAAGGGKSFTLRALALAAALSLPGINVYLFRREYKDLVLNHVEGPSGFEALLPTLPARMLSSTLTIDFENGSKIFLCHCQHPKDRYGYQGAEIHILLLDELTLFDEAIYTFLRARCRVVGITPPKGHFLEGRLPLIVSGSNPGNIGHNWVKATFIDPSPAMELFRTPKKEGGMLRQYIPAKLKDNKILLEQDPDYGDRLSGLGDEELVRAMLEGDWDIVAGTMFGRSFRRAQHVIPPIEVKPGAACWRSLDWGSYRPYCVLWFTLAEGVQGVPDGSIIVFNELYGVRYGDLGVKANVGVEKTPQEVADDILKEEERMGISVKTGWADPSIWAKAPQSTSHRFDSVGRMFLSKGIAWRKAANDRVNGWQVLHQHFAGKREKGTPDLYITSNCLHLIRTLPVLPRHAIKPDDLDSQSEDHAADALRYGMTPRIRPERVEMTSEAQDDFIAERVVSLTDFALGKV